MRYFPPPLHSHALAAFLVFASGEEPEHAPENQGFEYSYYGLFNGAPDLWPDASDLQAGSASPLFLDFPGLEGYKEDSNVAAV